MTEEEAKYLIVEYKPVIGFVKYREALNVAINALEKQIPKKVNLYIGNDMSCPLCGHRLRGYEGVRNPYCKYCGQQLER